MVTVPPPTDPEVLPPARNEGALGLGYYIPPELRQFGRNLMAFAGAIDPVQGIMRGMRASGRAFDSELPPEERKAAAIEAAIETLAPVGMIGLGALAKQPVKATLMDVLTPTGAPASMTDEAVEAVSDPSRRAFMKGAAATGGIAALAPDLAMEAMDKVPAAVTKTAARAAAVSPINMAAENIRFLKNQNEQFRELRDETLDQIGPSQEADSIVRDINYNEDQIFDEVKTVLEEMSPADFKAASNDSLEEIAAFKYDAIDGGGKYVMMDEELPNFKSLIDEARSRGLHTAKDENGIDKYPNISAMVYDADYNKTFDFESFQKISVPETVKKMTDDSGKSTEQLIKELTDDAFKSQYEFVKKQLEETTDFSPEKIDRIARKNAGRSGRNMAEGGVVENVGSIRALGNLEYEADMRPFLQDSLSQLGFNPDKASYNSQGLNRGDTYSFFSDKINIDPKRGGASQEIQAHEYRHRGLQRLLDDYFMKDPGRFKEKYGTDAYNLMLEVYDESRGNSENLTRTGQKNSIHEKIAEYFQKPQKFNMGVLYYTSDGGVFQTEEEVREYVQKNPGVEFMRKEIEGEADITLETPRVKEFRDYMINKNRGETMQQGTDSEFEAVQSIQKAAADVLSGKYGKGGVVSFAPYLR